MLLAWYDVETIVGTFPALIVMGVMVIVPAMRRSSWWLLGYGLSAFWAVAFVSLVIAIFDLSPSEAVHIVPLILTVYAIFQGLWCIRCNCALLEKPATNIANLPRLQFSIRAMLLLTTVVCVLSAVGRSIPWKNEMWVFGSGGLALLGVSAVIMFWFTVRIKNIRQAT